MLVPARLHELDDAEPTRELVAGPFIDQLCDPAELRSQQPAGGRCRCGSELLLEYRTDRVEVTLAPSHDRGPFGAITSVMLRPSKVAMPSAWPTSLRSSAMRSSKARPRSGCSLSRPR